MAGAATVSADDRGALIQAATEAANAAAEATRALRAQQSSRSSFQETSKVVKVPEPFDSENHEQDLARWQDFQVNFRAWLYYRNPCLKRTCIGLNFMEPLPFLQLLLLVNLMKCNSDASSCKKS